MSKILVTGGSGFVGTTLCKHLIEQGYDVYSIDRYYKEIEGVTSIDLINSHYLPQHLKEISPDVVIHLAASHQLGKSVKDPAKYYNNNISFTITLLNAMVEANIKYFVFASSSSVFGNNNIVPQDETVPVNPINPYAKSKAVIEQLLPDYEKAYGLKYAVLRYFNVAGAMPDLSHGYTLNPASHILPIACQKLLKGETLTINGNSYPTKDGTCERDYTHVYDIARATSMSMSYIMKNNVSDTFNIGRGTSVSNLDTVDTLNSIADTELKYEIKDSRPGDHARAEADNRKAKDLLGWEPLFALEDIVRHAYEWEKKNI